MTIADLEEILVRNDLALGYLGLGSRTGDALRKGQRYACTIQPRQGSRVWQQEEFKIRGTGPTMTEAVEDALTKLSVFLIDKVEQP